MPTKKLDANTLYAQLGAISKSTEQYLKSLRGFASEVGESKSHKHLLTAFNEAFQDVENRLDQATKNLTRQLYRSSKAKAERLNQICKLLNDSINWYKFFIENITQEDPKLDYLLQNMNNILGQIGELRREALENVVKIEKQYSRERRNNTTGTTKVSKIRPKKPNVYITDPPYNTQDTQSMIPPNKLVLSENKK